MHILNFIEVEAKPTSLKKYKLLPKSIAKGNEILVCRISRVPAMETFCSEYTHILDWIGVKK